MTAMLTITNVKTSTAATRPRRLLHRPFPLFLALAPDLALSVSGFVSYVDCMGYLLHECSNVSFDCNALSPGALLLARYASNCSQTRLRVASSSSEGTVL